ncbi:MAG TPA: hypothetical protein PLO33_11895 [Kouleothrix sp.]|nr:hypothetical protein [Kouleothrix sp.]
MQFKRMLSLFGLVMAAALVLAACGVSTQQQGGGTARNASQ